MMGSCIDPIWELNAPSNGLLWVTSLCWVNSGELQIISGGIQATRVKTEE